VRPTVLPNEGSTVGIKTGLAPLPPIIEEDDTVCIGLVGSDGDALSRGSALMELKRGEGGSLEPVGDGADMFHSSGFDGHERKGYPSHIPCDPVNFYYNHKTHGRGKKASATGR
jgi:hypothetical protein